MSGVCQFLLALAPTIQSDYVVRHICSQVQLRMFASFSELFMGRVERGEVATSMDQLEKICKLLKVDGRALLRQCVKQCPFRRVINAVDTQMAISFYFAK